MSLRHPRKRRTDRNALLRNLPGAIVPKDVPKGTRVKASTPEQVTQDLTEQYLSALGLAWFHMPPYILAAAFRRRPMSGAELGAAHQASQIVKGLPDLLVFSPTGRFLALELKTDAKTSKLSAAQRLWRAEIGTREARSFEEAKNIIDAWWTLIG